MFDIKKICQKALLRAEEIRIAKKRKRRCIILYGSLAMVCVCAVTLAMLVTFNPALEWTAVEGVVISFLDERGTPLGEAPSAVGENEREAAINIYLSDMGFRHPGWFTFEISLAGVAEKLYVSDFIESMSSMRLDNIAVPRALESGSYPAIMLIRAYERPDWDSYFWQSSVEFTLKVH